MFGLETTRGGILRTLMFSAALAAAGALAMPAGAQEMKAPEGDIDLTIGAGPGSGPDLLARRIAKILNEEGIVENTIVVNNRTGGSWTVASTYVIDHAGDENLVFGISPTVFATPIVRGVPNFYEKVTPLAMTVAADLLLVTSANAPYDSLADVVEAAKAQPGSIAMAGANVGSTDHIVSSLLGDAAGIEINFVPFDGGGGQITSALLGNAVQLAIYPPDEALPLMEGNQIKPLAILSAERSAADKFKDIPTAKEQGFDVMWDSPQSIGLPPETDPALVAWWDDKLAKMVETDAWKSMVAENYFRDIYTRQSETKAAMDELYQRYLAVLTKLGLAKPQQ